MSACCGHGEPAFCYAVLDDGNGTMLLGREALGLLSELGGRVPAAEDAPEPTNLDGWLELVIPLEFPLP